MKKKSDHSANMAELPHQANRKLSRPRKKEQASFATEADIPRLVHELQICHTELEARNEELAQSQAKMEELLKQYNDLYDFAPVGFFTLTRNGTIRQVNLTGASLLGMDRSALIKRRFGQFVSAEFRPAFNAFLEMVSGCEEKQNCEIALTKNGNELIWVNVEATCSEDGQEFRALVVDITEQHKQAQQTLLGSETRFRAMIENSADAITLIDAQGFVTYDSPSAPGMLGYDPEEWIGKSIFELIHADDLRETRELLQELTGKKAAHVHSIFRVRHKSGSWLWLEAVATNLLDKPGVNAIIVNYRDITERKRSEEALRESEERFRSLFNRMLDGVYRSKHEGKFVDVNSAMVKMFGYSSREEMLEVNIKNELYFEPEERGSHVLDTGKEEMDVYRMRRKDGSEIWVEDHGSYVHDEQGRIIYHEGILRDITERKRADQTLAESEERFKTMFLQAPLGMALVDSLTGEIYEANPRFAEIAGRSMKEMENIDWMQITHPDDLQADLDNQKLLNAGKIDGFQMEKRYLHPDGTVVWVSMKIAPLSVKGGTHPRQLCMIEDITERKRMEEIARESEVRYRSLFEDSPVSLWEEDFSAVKLRLDALRDEGIKDFRVYFASHPQVILECISLVKIVDVNKATLKLFGAKDKADLLQNLSRFIDNDSAQGFQNELICIAQGKSHFEWEGVNQTLDGRKIIVRLSLSVTPGYEDSMSKVIISMVDITAHMHAEKAVRESERSLRESQIIAGLGNYTLELASEKWTSSDILNQIYGIDESYSRTVESWLALVHPDWRQEMSDYFSNEVLENRKLFDKEYKIVRRNDGAERWVHGLGKLELNAQNQIVKIHGSVQDITERKLAEDLLRKSEKRYHDLFEDSPISLREEDFSAVKQWLDTLRQEGVTDIRTYLTLHPEVVVECAKMVKITDVNKAALKMYRAESKNNMPNNLAEILNSKNIEHFKDQLVNIAEGQIEFSWEGTDQTIDGGQVYVEANWSVLAGYENDLSKVIVSLQNITERKQAEEALHESEALYRQAIEVAGGVPYREVYTHDSPVVKYQFIGEGIRQITGYGPEEFDSVLWDSLVQEVHPVEELVGYSVDDAIQMVRSGEVPIWKCDFKVKNRNGEIRWVFEAAVELRDEHGVSRGSIGIYQDITERKKAEEALKQRAHELQTLYQTSMDVNRQASLDTLLSSIVERASSLLGSDSGGMYMMEPHGRSLKLVVVHNIPNEFLGTELMLGEGLSGQVAQSGKPINLEDYQTWTGRANAYKNIVFRRTLGVPLKVKDKMIGVLNVSDYERTGLFSEDQVRLVGLFADQAALAIDRVRLSESAQLELSERKQAEESLRRSEERYRALFEDMPISIWEEDFSDVKKRLDSLKEQGVTDFRKYFEHNPEIFLECGTMIKVLDVNQATLKMYHADSKKDLYKNMDDGLSESEVEHIRDALIAISDGKISHSWEGADETVTGETIEVSLSWTVAPGHEIDFSRVIVTTQDITARKLAEEALRKSEAQFRAIFEGAATGIALVDTSGHPVRVNSALEEMLGYDAQELRNMVFTDFTHPDDVGLDWNLWHELIEGLRNDYQIEKRFIHKGGHTIWARLTTSRVTSGADGKILFGIGMVEDITDRKLREREQEALASITQALNQGLDLEILLQNLLGAALHAVPLAEKGAILLLDDENTLRIRALSGYHDPRVRNASFPSTSGYSARAVRERQPLIIADARADSPIRYNDEIEEMRAIQSAIAVPLIVKGRAIGAISLDNASRKNAFVESELTTLSTFASSAALIIQNTLLFEETRQRVAELELLYESGLAISQLLNPKEIGQKIIDLLEQKMNWHHTAIRLYNKEDETLELLAFHQPNIKNDEERIAAEARFKTMVSRSTQGLSGWVVQHGETVRTGNLTNDGRYVETFPGLHSGLYVPIKTGERTIGVISIESEKENAFSRSDEQLTAILATQAASIFENARLYQEIIQHADELERRVTERTIQIEATKRRLELATHAGQIGVWEYTPRENKVIWDERMHMIHGISEGEFNGTSENWAKLIHPDDLEISNINKQLAFTKNLLLNNEYRILWPDGSVHHIMTSAVTTYSPEGLPDRIIGINMDITERKQIEQSLRDSENYARLLFDAVPDPVSVTEANGVIVDVNKVFENQYGFSRDEIRGAHISELDIYPATELDKREKYISEVLQSQPAEPVELDFYVPGDRVHTLELHSYPLEVNGRHLVLNTSHDITSHKRAEEVQRHAKSEMERALRIKNEFLANMSHELRTPLNSILGISESLEEQLAGTLNEKQLKYIGVVRESGRHLLELINDILDLSKIEAGRMNLDVHHISVEKFCQSSLRMVKELAQKKSLNVSYKVNGNVKVILGDERRLKQALVNLLGNAVKFTPPGSRIGLEVSDHSETNEVTFTVWDQGIGIAQKDIQHLFKPFVQLDGGLAREYQGTGLGLALVAQMVHLHGGRVSVESEPGKGSRFTITLPWLPKEQTPKVKVTSELLLPSQRSEKKRSGRILLVEDTDVVVQLISEYLGYKGYEVILAHNGVDGIKLALQERPDLILMDVMMPVMNGLDATKNIRKDQTMQNVPIIALTALAMSGDSERCLDAGMNDYLSKPIHMQDLADMIEKYLKPGRKESNEQ